MQLTSHKSHLSVSPECRESASVEKKIAGICNYKTDQPEIFADICNSNSSRLEGRNYSDTGQHLVEFYLKRTQASSTRAAYTSDIEHFLSQGGFFPATSETIARYLAEHARDFKVATLKRRVAALCWFHKSHGFSDPTKDDLVRRVMRGIERHHGAKQKQALPLCWSHIDQIARQLGAAKKDVRDKALLLIGYWGAFRGSELTKLCAEECYFQPGGVSIHLERSKTDQSSRGRWVAVSSRPGPICPVSALKAWIDTSGCSNGFVFRSIKGATPDVVQPLSVRSLSRMIQGRVKQIGLDPQGYSSHSLRAGFVTNQINAGADAVSIARQTGHKSIEMVMRYDRPLTVGFAPTFEGGRELFTGSGRLEEIHNLCGQGAGQALEHSDSRVFKPSFQSADIGPVDFRVDRQGLLRDAPGDPEFSEIVSNDTLSLHVVKSSSCR